MASLQLSPSVPTPMAVQTPVQPGDPTAVAGDPFTAVLAATLGAGITPPTAGQAVPAQAVLQPPGLSADKAGDGSDMASRLAEAGLLPIPVPVPVVPPPTVAPMAIPVASCAGLPVAPMAPRSPESEAGVPVEVPAGGLPAVIPAVVPIHDGGIRMDGDGAGVTGTGPTMPVVMPVPVAGSKPAHAADPMPAVTEGEAAVVEADPTGIGGQNGAPLALPQPVAPPSRGAAHRVVPADAEPLITPDPRADSQRPGVGPLAPTVPPTAPTSERVRLGSGRGPTLESAPGTTEAARATPSPAPPPASSLPAAPVVDQPAPPAAPRSAQGEPNPLERMVVSQVSRAVLQRSAEGDRRLVIRLTPPELGTVRVELIERDGQMTAHIHAEDPGVRQALDRMLPQMRSDLRANDGVVNAVVLGDGGRAAWNGADQSGGGAARDQQGRRDGDGPQRIRGVRSVRGERFSLDLAAATAAPTATDLGGRVDVLGVNARA